ncbi:MAG: alpha/beta hydrolase [Myxococcales bacterium]|nr:alpha/beta hydrolase [Myxococcales bacterium]
MHQETPSAAPVVIDEASFFTVRGVPQWVTIRGRDRANPAVLVLHGPGYALSTMPALYRPWERAFTVIHWDQPGAGATYGRSPDAALSIDRIARDGIALLEQLRPRFGRALLFAISGGTVVGLTIARRRPDLVAAYAGCGQITCWARQEALGYTQALADARAAGDVAAVDALTRIGPPPYPDAATDAIKARHVGAMTSVEQAALAALLAAQASEGGPRRAPETAYADPMELSLQTYSKLRAELVAFDARAAAPTLEVPVLCLQGARDRVTPTAEVAAYLDELRAPSKRLERIEGAGHSAFLLRDALLEALVRGARPFAEGR